MGPVSGGSPAADRFGSCWQKLARARKHTEDISGQIRDFWSADPFQLEPVPDDSATVTRVRVTNLSPVPAIIAMTAGDAAHNIRSALDHFAWAAVSSSAQSTRTCFPIGTAASRDPVRWHQQVQQKLNGASPALANAVAKMEPWEGGKDESLWAVHELDRLDKHLLLVSAAVALGRIELHGDSYELRTVKKYSGLRPDGPLPLEPAEWTQVEENTVLTIPLTSPDVGGTGTTLAFNIVLAEPRLLRTTPADTALMALADKAEETLRRLSPLA